MVKFGQRVCHSGVVRRQAPDKKRISSKTTLTLTRSCPTAQGTARTVTGSFQNGWIRRRTEDDSPSLIRWERARVRASVPQNPKLFLHESLTNEAPRIKSRSTATIAASGPRRASGAVGFTAAFAPAGSNRRAAFGTARQHQQRVLDRTRFFRFR